MRIRTCVVILLSLTVLTVSNCGGGGASAPTAPTTPPPSTTFQGTVAGTSSQTGTLSVTVQSSVARSWFPWVAVLHAQGVGATGVIRIAGSAAVSLSGSFASTPQGLSLTGGGFSLTGSFANGVLAGSYSAPGNVSGGFSALPSTNATVTRYCGTYSVTTPLQPINGVAGTYTETGTFNLQVSSTGVVSGIGAALTPDQRCCTTLAGQVSGATITVSSSEGGGGTGTISGGTLSGTTSSPSGRGSGSFSGSSGACPS